MQQARTYSYSTRSNSAYTGALSFSQNRSEGCGFGFNGQLKDDEWSGNGNSYTTEFRQYDPRLGRWMSIDLLMQKYPYQSPYASYNDNPLFFSDPTGLEGDDSNADGLSGCDCDPPCPQTFSATTTGVTMVDPTTTVSTTEDSAPSKIIPTSGDIFKSAIEYFGGDKNSWEAKFAAGFLDAFNPLQQFINKSANYVEKGEWYKLYAPLAIPDQIEGAFQTAEDFVQGDPYTTGIVTGGAVQLIAGMAASPSTPAQSSNPAWKQPPTARGKMLEPQILEKYYPGYDNANVVIHKNNPTFDGISANRQSVVSIKTTNAVKVSYTTHINKLAALPFTEITLHIAVPIGYDISIFATTIANAQKAGIRVSITYE